jgi:hypothetical protein
MTRQLELTDYLLRQMVEKKESGQSAYCELCQWFGVCPGDSWIEDFSLRSMIWAAYDHGRA